MVPVVTRAWNEEFSTSRRFISLSNEMKVYVHATKSQEQAKFKQQILTLNLRADIWAYLTIPGKFICQD